MTNPWVCQVTHCDTGHIDDETFSGPVSQGMPQVMDFSPDLLSPQAVRILDAALTCIGRVGLAKTTLDDVAREAGCARGTLYRYFPGKPLLVGAIVAREAQRISSTLVAATSN